MYIYIYIYIYLHMYTVFILLYIYIHIWLEWIIPVAGDDGVHFNHWRELLRWMRPATGNAAGQLQGLGDAEHHPLQSNSSVENVEPQMEERWMGIFLEHHEWRNIWGIPTWFGNIRGMSNTIWKNIGVSNIIWKNIGKCWDCKMI